MKSKSIVGNDILVYNAITVNEQFMQWCSTEPLRIINQHNCMHCF